MDEMLVMMLLLLHMPIFYANLAGEYTTSLLQRVIRIPAKWSATDIKYRKFIIIIREFANNA